MSETGKILPLASTLVATPASSNIRTVASTSNRRRAGARKAPLVAECLLNGPDAARPRGIVGRIDRAGDHVEPAQAPGIGDIAPSAAGHQDLHAGSAVFLGEQDPCADSAARAAATNPAAPAPSTTTSKSSIAVRDFHSLAMQPPERDGFARPVLQISWRISIYDSD